MIGSKMVVGSEEWCSFPTLGVPAIKARVDSGARTSSIHAFNIQTLRRGGELRVSFELHPIQHNRRVVIRCELPVIDHRAVKSSSGHSEKRYVVRVPMKLGDQSWEVELTLANRDSMGYRMLLGREAMGGRMLVDPAAGFCHGELSRQQLDELYGRDHIHSGGLKIALLATNPELYSNRRLLEAGAERGHEMLFIDLRECYIKLDAERPEIHFRGDRLRNEFDAVIPRIRPSMTFYGCALVSHFERLGIYSLNNALAINRVHDRFAALQLLLDKGIAIPASGLASAALDTGDVIKMIGGAPLIIKPLDGASERSVIHVESRKAAENVIDAYKAVHANLLVQACVREAQGRSLRCVVADGKVVAAIERDINSADHAGEQSIAMRKSALSVEERKLARKAVHATGLRVAGVDLLRTAQGPLLLEVVASPALEEIETVTSRDVAAAMIGVVEKKLGWRQSSSE